MLEQDADASARGSLKSKMQIQDQEAGWRARCGCKMQFEEQEAVQEPEWCLSSA